MASVDDHIQPSPLAMSQEKVPFAYHSNPRTKQHGIDIDVFLEPLMEEMEKFWKHGVEMWDEYRRETFTLKAIVFITINDYPALFSLPGQKKGKNTLCSLFEWYNICVRERI
jgi:hypothetical protein